MYWNSSAGIISDVPDELLVFYSVKRSFSINHYDYNEYLSPKLKTRGNYARRKIIGDLLKGKLTRYKNHFLIMHLILRLEKPMLQKLRNDYYLMAITSHNQNNINFLFRGFFFKNIFPGFPLLYKGEICTFLHLAIF